MQNKTLDFKTEIKSSEDNEKKTFEAYAAFFGNVDSYNDVILKGSFVESLKKRNPKLAYQHDYTKLVGVITDAREDDNGLKVKGEFLETDLGKQVYQEVKAGAIDSMSIGFSINDSEFTQDGVRQLKGIDLFEVSFVTFPANEKAVVTSVKANDIKTIRDFEKHLRDVGFSSNESKLIASKGFKNKDQRDVETQETLKQIKELTNKLRGN